MSEELTNEEREFVDAVVEKVEGKSEKKYVEPACPSSVESKEEFFRKSLSDAEYGKYLANKVFNPIYTRGEEDDE